MSLNVKYKANKFLENLETLESFFVYIGKLYSIYYEENRSYLIDQLKGTNFYPSFYVERIAKLRTSFKKFFDDNDIQMSQLSDFYDLSIDFKDNLEISRISAFIDDVTEDISLKNGLNVIKKNSFSKDQVLMNYLVELENCLNERYDLHWLEWVKKYTKVPLKEKKTVDTSYSDLCFDEGATDYIIMKEISELDRLAYRLQKDIIKNFDSFIEEGPLTYIDNKLTEDAEKQLEELKRIQNRKGLKFSDKLIMLSKKVDGSQESIDLILQNLTVENFKSVLEEILKCIPGVLSIQELTSYILEGSFEALTDQFWEDIMLLLPEDIKNAVDGDTNVSYPWLNGSSDFDLVWYEAVLKYMDIVLTRYGYPSLYDIHNVLEAEAFPSAMYEILKLNYPDILPDLDFKTMLPMGQTIEEYLFLQMSPEGYSKLTQQGDENEVVQRIQIELNKNGYKDNQNNTLVADGKFGLKTKQAVKNFQRENKDNENNPLSVNGKVGEKTWNSLFSNSIVFDLFTTDKSRYEALLLELIILKQKLIDRMADDSIIPDFSIPSFANFFKPKIAFPNFKNRDIIQKDYHDLKVFANVYFPKLNIIINSSPELSLDSVMTEDTKRVFFKDIYQIIEMFLLERSKNNISIIQILEEIFKNTNLITESRSSNILNEKELMYYSKLFTSKYTSILPSKASNLDSIDIEQIIMQSSLKIKQIKQLYDALMPDIQNYVTVGLENFSLDGLKPSPPDFDMTKFRLPNIPKIPSLKFNFVEFLSDKFYQLILKIIIKVLLTLLARTLDKLVSEACTNPQEGGLQNEDPDGGLKTLVGDIACPDKDATIESQGLIAKALKSMANVEENNNSITRIVEALSVCSTVEELAPAILGDKQNIKPGYLNKMSDIMNAVIPEYSDVLGTPEKVSEMFEQAGNLMNDEQRQALRDIIDQVPAVEIPVSNTICLSKSSLEEWKEERKTLFVNSGFDPQIAEDFIDRQRRRARDEVKEAVELAIKTPEDLFSDALNDMMNFDNTEASGNSEVEEECEDITRPKELKEKINEFSDDLLDRVNSVFIDDMLKPNMFFGDYKGALSKILSDKHDRTMSEVTNIKNNYFLNLLVKIGILQNPEFPETVFKDLSESLKSLNYEYNEQIKNTPPILDKPLFSLPILSSIKHSIMAINYKTPDLILSYDKNSLKPAEYMDYMYESPNLNGLKIGLDFIKPRNIKQTEFLENFSSFGFDENTTPKDIFAYLVGEENRDEYENVNSLVFSYMKNIFSETVDFGYPTEITKEDIELEGGDNESKTLAQLKNPNDRVEVLDPEIYGGSYEKPNIFVRPPDLNDFSGYYSYSRKLFSDNADLKLDNTILKLSQVSNYVKKSKSKIDQTRYTKAKDVKDKGDILEKPYSVMLPKDKVANIWGQIKILIRIYLSEYFTLGYPVIKKLGIKYENYGDLLFSYIEHRMTKDMSEMRDLGNPKSIYSPFIIYTLMLEMIGIKYITEKKDQLSDYLEQRKEEYQPLVQEEIDFIKSVVHNSILLDNIPGYSNYIKGFSAFSFNSNWLSVLSSSIGVNINSFNFDEREIRLAAKIGYILSDTDFLRDILKQAIIEEAQEYEKEFTPEIENVYYDFLNSEYGLDLDFDNISFEKSNDSYYIKKYIKITDKQGAETITDYDGLLDYIKDFPESSSISTVLGNAYIEDIYEKKYNGTIGIKLGISFGYKDIEISSYEKDMKDVLISEVKEIGENLGEDILCYVDEMLKTPRMNLFLKHCLKVEKVGSIAGIYFMKNAISSLGQGPDERSLQFELPFGDIIESLISVSNPDSIYTTTKKEILRNLNSYMYDESRDPIQEKENFTDFKKKQTINENFDSKNLQIDGAGEVPFFSRGLIKNNIELDKDGNPVVNKFLSTHFSED